MKRWMSGMKFAFSLYSRIPVWGLRWEEEDASLTMCCFPIVGLALGSGMFGLYYLFDWLTYQGWNLHEITKTIGFVLFPIFFTGGIHMDGFLDTQDAIHSNLPKEERLRILKDVHTGAFALLSCSVYFLMLLGVYANLRLENLLGICLTFPLSRTMTGLFLFLLPQARKEGMLKELSAGWDKKVSLIVLGVYLLTLIVLLLLQGRVGVGILLGAMLSVLYFRHLALAKFGGITGDLCGYFLQVSELWMALGGILFLH